MSQNKKKPIKKSSNAVTVVSLILLCLVIAGVVVAVLYNLGVFDKPVMPAETETETERNPDGLSALELTAATAEDTVDIAKVKVSETPTDYCMISVKNFGVMVVKLDADNAPITVAHFQDLVANKFYDDLTFHRVVKSFMIQGGGYTTSGNKKDAGESIKGEFTENGVDNQLAHTRGVISMARVGGMNDSATSEFFIVTQTSANNTASLDGKYASFGKLVYGYSTLDKIAAVSCSANPNMNNEVSKPNEQLLIESVQFVTVD